MGSSNDVVVVSEDASVVKLVHEVVATRSHADGSSACRSLDELTADLMDNGRCAVIVDLDPLPTEVLADLPPLIDRHADSRFIVIAAEQHDDWVRAAMRAGARDFITKAALASDLAGVLDRLVPTDDDAATANHAVVTVLGAGGGCGGTMLSINLAHELSLEGCGNALILDLDEIHGGVVGQLGIKPQFGIADVLLDGERIDSHLIRSTATEHRSDLHVLASPAWTPADAAKECDFEHLPRAIRAMRRAYPVTIVDAPRARPEIAAALARPSVVTFLVFQMNVADIRIARHQLDRLFRDGIDPARVLPLLNRYHKRRSSVSLEELRKALRVDHVGVLRNDYTGVVSSINLGNTLHDTRPRSPLRRDIRRLATNITAAARSGGQPMSLE